MGPVRERLRGTIVATDLRQLSDGRWRVVAWYHTRKVMIFWVRDEGWAQRVYRDAETMRIGTWGDELG